MFETDSEHMICDVHDYRRVLQTYEWQAKRHVQCSHCSGQDDAPDDIRLKKVLRSPIIIGRTLRG